MTSPKMQRRLAPAHMDSVAESFGSEILDERSFTTMLCLERKRTERSGRRFVLMLLESHGLVRHRDHGETALDSVMRTLVDSTRETDIKGWYKEQSIVGVIFTEVGSADGKVVANALLTRVTAALSSTLTIDDINRIHISFHVFPDELAEQETGPPDLTLYPDQGSGSNQKQGARLVKRTLDILGSLLAMALFSPLLLAIAAAVKATSRGSVLFRQQRVGRYGRRFTFLKFRSMYVANDESIHREYVKRLITNNATAEGSAQAQKPAFKIRNDPRVTPIGRILRRTSLDELPQLFNVLRGEMSLVGPRPPIPYEYACYNTWHRRRLLTVKPGITGLWQVKGRSRVSFDEMVRLDLKYAETWSVWLDLKILCLTPAAVMSGEGAY